jgi:MmgE/PrpD C-terminal domain
VITMRGKVTATIDESLGIDQAEAVIAVDGARHRAFIEHATGTAANPMSEAALEAKFMANTEPVIGRDRAQRVRDLVGGLDRLADVRELTGLCA